MKIKWCVAGFLLLVLCAGVQVRAQSSDTNFVEDVKTKAKSGDVIAQNNLGVSYYIGQGVAKDYVEAVNWFRKAAGQNNANSQYCLGVCYAKGRGVAKDEVEAVRWYRKAAEQNYAEAQYNLQVYATERAKV